ncbi:MAG: VgrG-related protein, partial [Candidatus Dormibacteria bacterium]
MSTVFAPQLMVTVNGGRLSPEAERCIDEVLVEDHLHLPGMFAMRFRTDADLTAEAGLEIGHKVAIRLHAVENHSTDAPVIEGEITGIEATLGPFGSHLVIRGYDVAHRLHRARVTHAYRNMLDSDVATEIAKRHAIPLGHVDPTSTVHEHLPQLNATDWEFLRARAREVGREVAVRGGRLTFTKASTTISGPQLPLTMGEQLLSFSPRISSATQVGRSQVRGWDPGQKLAIVGSADAHTGAASLSTGPAHLAGLFGAPTQVSVDRPLARQGEADVAASALADSLGSTFVEAEGVARGDPYLRAGAPVRIEGAGSTFDGTYVLT